MGLLLAKIFIALIKRPSKLESIGYSHNVMTPQPCKLEHLSLITPLFSTLEPKGLPSSTSNLNPNSSAPNCPIWTRFVATCSTPLVLPAYKIYFWIIPNWSYGLSNLAIFGLKLLNVGIDPNKGHRRNRRRKLGFRSDPPPPQPSLYKRLHRLERPTSSSDLPSYNLRSAGIAAGHGYL